MSLTVFFAFLLLSFVIIFLSLVFICRQLNANQLRRDKMHAGEVFFHEERQKRIDSIQVLLKVSGSDEMNWVEASIRIKNLLDQLGVDLSYDDDISAFYIVTEKTEHIPTHEQWQALPKEAKVKFRKEISHYEQEYYEHLLRAKSALQGYSF